MVSGSVSAEPVTLPRGTSPNPVFWTARALLRLSKLRAVIRPRLSPHDAIRACGALGGRDAGGESVLILELGQFFAQSRRFLAILCRVHVVLDGGDAADRIHKLADSVVLAVLAFAHVFEVVGN